MPFPGSKKKQQSFIASKETNARGNESSSRKKSCRVEQKTKYDDPQNGPTGPEGVATSVLYGGDEDDEITLLIERRAPQQQAACPMRSAGGAGKKGGRGAKMGRPAAWAPPTHEHDKNARPKEAKASCKTSSPRMGQHATRLHARAHTEKRNTQPGCQRTATQPQP